MTDVTPLPGSFTQVYLANGSDSSYANEPMEEIDMTVYGFARYTVYRIADPTKRVIHDNAVPVFKLQTGGSGSFNVITPGQIWYPAGYIVLSAAAGPTDVVECASGNYWTPFLCFGCTSRSFNTKTASEDITCYGDTALKRFPTIDDWDAKLDAFFAAMQASYLTTGGNANSHVQLNHELGGTAGNSITYAVVNPGGTNGLAVTVTGPAIQVSAATSVGAIISTSAQVVAAINASVGVIALGVRASIPAGEDGTGVVAALGATPLAGGLDPIAFKALKGSRIVVIFYDNYSSGNMFVGYGNVDQVDWAGTPKDLVKDTLTITGAEYPLYRVKETFGLFGGMKVYGDDILKLPGIEPAPFIPVRKFLVKRGDREETPISTDEDDEGRGL